MNYFKKLIFSKRVSPEYQCDNCGRIEDAPAYWLKQPSMGRTLSWCESCTDDVCSMSHKYRTLEEQKILLMEELESIKRKHKIPKDELDIVMERHANNIILHRYKKNLDENEPENIYRKSIGLKPL